MKQASESCPTATTRATLARFGRPVVATVDGEKLVISPYEIPGEVEWRVDLLHWHVLQITYELLLFPRDAADAHLERLRSALVLDGHLHFLEAACVVDAASDIVGRLRPRIKSISMKVVLRLERRIQVKWDRLMERYAALVLASARKMADAA